MRYILSLLIMALTLSFGVFVFSDSAVAQDPGCGVFIIKQTIPEDDTGFPFTISGEINDEFVLQDTDEEFFFLPPNSVVKVTEQAPAGWVLRDVACGNSTGSAINITRVSNGVQLECEEDSDFLEIDCTFINAKAETIPTFSQWGIVALIVVLGLVAFMVLRRKKATA